MNDAREKEERLHGQCLDQVVAGNISVVSEHANGHVQFKVCSCVDVTRWGTRKRGYMYFQKQSRLTLGAQQCGMHAPNESSTCGQVSW